MTIRKNNYYCDGFGAILVMFYLSDSDSVFVLFYFFFPRSSFLFYIQIVIWLTTPADFSGLCTFLISAYLVYKSENNMIKLMILIKVFTFFWRSRKLNNWTLFQINFKSFLSPGSLFKTKVTKMKVGGSL